MSYSITEFERIYKCNVGSCMVLATRLLGNEDDARDVVQDVFLKLWESKIEISNPQAFVIRAVRNASLDRLRTISVRDRVRQNLPIEPVTADDDVGENRAAVLQAIDSLLTDRQKQVIDKVYEEGLSYKDTAASLDVSVSMVNKSIVTAMKTLRTHFKTNKR